MSEPAYTARISLLKQFSRSAAHAKAFIDGGKNDETLSMRLGSGTHALLFGTPPVVIYRGGEFQPEGAKKPKTYSDVRNGAMWDGFKAKHEGSVILNETEHAKAAAMVRALQTHPDADPLLFAIGTLHEHKIRFLLGGRWCSGTIDAISPSAVVDLKSTVDASPRRFPFQARNLGHHAQLAWYLDGAELAGMGEGRWPYVVAVENSPPFNVQVYKLTDADIRDGRRLYNEWLDRLLECEAADHWPGYADGVLPLNVLNLPPLPEDDADDDVDSSSDESEAA